MYEQYLYITLEHTRKNINATNKMHTHTYDVDNNSSSSSTVNRVNDNKTEHI